MTAVEERVRERKHKYKQELNKYKLKLKAWKYRDNKDKKTNVTNVFRLIY
jgi:hypothetical protein